MTPARAAALAARALPGGEPRRVRRFTAAASRRVYEVTLAAGERARRLVVRDYGDEPDAAAFEAELLRRLTAHGMPVPELVLAEPPALVISRLPGAPRFAPADVRAWAEGLADALAIVHRLPASSFADLVPDQGRDLAEHLSAGPSDGLLSHPVGPALWDRLVGLRPTLAPVEPSLLHGDYFAGNVLWSRVRVSGVIDWEAAGLGPPASDVGNCRAELAMHHSLEAADLFLARYEQVAGPLPDLPFWDLLGAQWLLPDPERYLDSLRTFGADWLTRESVQRTLTDFVARALTRP